MTKENSTAAAAAAASAAITLIGQGGFGCVYYRGFDSHGNMLSKKYITKITKREKTREIIIGKAISKLPGYDAFFATVISLENINLGVIDPSNLTECNIIKKYTESTKSRSGSGTIPEARAQFQILKELYVPNVSLLVLAETVVGNVSKLLNTIINCHGHTLIGIRRMQDEVGVVHYDIKSQNVIFNTRSKNPIVIDFGLSFFISDVQAALLLPDAEAVVALKSFFYGYFPDYDVWPLEVHVISYIVNTTNRTIRDAAAAAAASAAAAAADSTTATESGIHPVAVLTSDALNGMVNEFVNQHHFISYQTDEYKKKYRARTIGHFQQTAVGRPGMTVIRELVAKWKMWDFYSVAAMFLDVLEVVRQTYSAEVLLPVKFQIDAFTASLRRDANL